MPYFCHLSNHLWTRCTPCDEDHCGCVHQWDDYVMPNTPLFGTVPGGANDNESYRFHKDFDKGMNEYQKAKGEGLQPAATTVEAVKAEQDRVRSQERAVQKLKKTQDVSGIHVAPGVEV